MSPEDFVVPETYPELRYAAAGCQLLGILRRAHARIAHAGDEAAASEVVRNLVAGRNLIRGRGEIERFRRESRSSTYRMRDRPLAARAQFWELGSILVRGRYRSALGASTLEVDYYSRYFDAAGVDYCHARAFAFNSAVGALIRGPWPRHRRAMLASTLGCVLHSAYGGLAPEVGPLLVAADEAEEWGGIAGTALAGILREQHRALSRAPAIPAFSFEVGP